MAGFGTTSSAPQSGQNTLSPIPTQNYQSLPPSGPTNVRTPISGLPTRGVIVNAPTIENCAINANDLIFITVEVPAQPGVQCIADLLVELPSPCNKFAILSITDAASNNSLFLHLSPLRKQYPVGSAAILIDGTEAWFSMKVKAFADVEGVMWKFSSPVDRIFFDCGFEIGGGTSYAFTIVATTDDGFDFRPNIQIGHL